MSIRDHSGFAPRACSLDIPLPPSNTPPEKTCQTGSLSDKNKKQVNPHVEYQGYCPIFGKAHTRIEPRFRKKESGEMPGQANTKTIGKPPSMQDFTDAVQSVPEVHRKELLSLMQEFSDKVKHRPQRPSPTNRLEMREMGIETYPEFKKRTGSTDGKECLRQNWGEWLKAFNPQLDRDYISSADIRNLDLKLLGRLQRQYKTGELHKFLPSLPMRNAQIGKTRNPEEAKEMYRIAQIIERYAQHPS